MGGSAGATSSLTLGLDIESYNQQNQTSTVPQIRCIVAAYPATHMIGFQDKPKSALEAVREENPEHWQAIERLMAGKACCSFKTKCVTCVASATEICWHS